MPKGAAERDTQYHKSDGRRSPELCSIDLAAADIDVTAAEIEADKARRPKT